MQRKVMAITQHAGRVDDNNERLSRIFSKWLLFLAIMLAYEGVGA